MTRVSAAEAIAPLGNSLFGDSTNYYSGATTFSVTDIDLPGNSALPVRLTRTHSASAVHGPTAPALLGEWELEAPHIHGVYSKVLGWQVSGANPNARCSAAPFDRNPPTAPTTVFLPGAPPAADQGFLGEDYWSGNSLAVPGYGDQSLLTRSAANTLVPTDGQIYPWATLSHWQLRCLTTLASGDPGEGFLALAPDGTKYTLNWMAKRRTAYLSRNKLFGQTNYSFILERDEVRLYATHVEDRFGNWVKYDYVGGQLVNIEANDGRKITLEYYPTTGTLHYARAHGRTWEYNYTGSRRLSEVILPDASKWSYDTTVLVFAYDPNAAPACGPQAFTSSVKRENYTMTHPSGAVGFFEFDPTHHARNKTMPECMPDQGTFVQGVAKRFDNYALARKTISGPGVAPLTWTLAFGAQSPFNTTKLATLTMPNGEQTRFTFGTEFYKNEGKLLKEEVLSASGTQLRLTENGYAINPVDPPYAYQVGYGVLTEKADEFASSFQVPLSSTSISQQGKTFQENYDFDRFARTVDNIYRPPQLAGYRHNKTLLKDDLNTWTLGLVVRRNVSTYDRVPEPPIGIILEEREYQPGQTQPYRIRSLGSSWRNLSYFSDGTLNTITNALGRTTTLDNWKRGTPRQVTYADQKYTTEEIDDFGAISSQTDELFNTTTIGRDSAGRINSITHPAADSVSWNSLGAGFVQVQSAAFGLPANHWERTVTIGTKTTRQYFDALYRPVLTEEFDADNPSNTSTYVTAQFDHAGRTTFQGYPVRSIASYNTVLPGVRTSYDALGRATAVSQSSELGDLATVTEYLSGFKKRVTNARGKATTFDFLTFGTPSEEFPVRVSLPENVVIDIARDNVGRPFNITRSGLGLNNEPVSSTRRTVYDGVGRVCAISEPERGVTYSRFNADDTVEWTAIVSNGNLNCVDSIYASIPEAAKTYSYYDARKRLTGVSFPDGTPGTALTYYDDGAVETASSDGTKWEFFYNKRRFLTQEKLTVGTKVYTLGYGFDANANASSMTYPDGVQIDYLPNALGQPSKVGSFANGLQYSASGALTNFNYGNTLTHTMTQNARLLPGRVRVRNAAGTTSILDTTLSFDENGNVLGLTDGVATTNQSRSMTYDDLDRLKTVFSSASSMFGGASYNYDGLDNLTSLSVAAGPKARSYTYNYSQATQRLTDITNANTGQAAFNLGYDARGNVTSRSGIGSTTVGFIFDRAERIRQFNSSVIGASENYTYDAKGRRALITKAGDASKQRYQLYSGTGQLVWEEDSDGLKKRHVYLGGTLLAREDFTVAPAAPAPPASLDILALSCGFSNCPINTSFRLSWPISSTPVPAGSVFKYKLQRCQLDSGLACDWDNNTLFFAAPNAGQTTLIWQPAVPAAGVDFGGLHSFRVSVCVNDICDGAWRNSVNRGVTPPKTLVQVPASAQISGFQISWAAAPGATSYAIERRLGTSGSWSTVVADTTSLNAQMTPPSDGSYQFRATAINSYGNRGAGVESALVSYTQPVVCTPGVPENFASTAGSISATGTFDLTWTPSGCNTVQYLITRKINGNFDQLLQIPANTVPLKLAQVGLANGLYEYIISACKAPAKGQTTCSPDSAPLPVQVARPTGLTPPQNVQVPATARISTSYNLSWNAVASAHHYKVREDTGNITLYFDNITALFKAFTHAQVETYTYFVFACSAANECSAPSAPVSITLTCTGPGCNNRATKDVGTVTYIHTDQLGSPVAETNAAGTLTTRFRHEPFGQSLEANIAQGPGYTGHVADAASGLTYMQQRYYDPVIGRFLSTDPDPVGELGLNFNRYAYVGNNPYSYVDPDGRNPAAAVLGAIEVCGANPLCRAGAQAAGRAVVKSSVSAVETAGGAINSYLNESINAEYAVGIAQSVLREDASDDDIEWGELESNANKHHPNSQSPEPEDVEELYKNSERNPKNGERYAVDKDGVIHRFTKPSNGKTHWNGSTNTPGRRPIRKESIPIKIRRRLAEESIRSGPYQIEGTSRAVPK